MGSVTQKQRLCALCDPCCYQDFYVFFGTIMDCSLDAEDYAFFNVFSEKISYENVRPSLSFEHCFIIILYLTPSFSRRETKCSRNLHGDV